MPASPRLVVAIDGPSGSGKSTVSRAVARRYGLRYLDTGAMYRAVAWWMLRHGVDPADAGAVAARCEQPALVTGTDPDAPRISVDGTDVTAAVREADVSAAVSPVATVPEVRRRLVALQREIVGSGGIVVEGRDIGTVVVPDAPVKIYLTASGEARAARRAAETPGSDVSSAHANLQERDGIDSTRATDPLTRAADAHVVDATDLDVEGVVSVVAAFVDAALRQEGAA